MSCTGSEGKRSFEPEVTNLLLMQIASTLGVLTLAYCEDKGNAELVDAMNRIMDKIVDAVESIDGSE
tara:strand:- start:1916 stop:2116 length:201 start_codon:yes stop_codon:yes gene_type:complete